MLFMDNHGNSGFPIGMTAHFPAVFYIDLWPFSLYCFSSGYVACVPSKDVKFYRHLGKNVSS